MHPISWCQPIKRSLFLSILLLLIGCKVIDNMHGYDFSASLHTWELDERPNEVLEDSRFESLTESRAKLASQLDEAGTFIGKYVGDDLSEHDIVGYLLDNHIVDANLHIVATIYLMAEGHDETGYWALLVSEDPYWTNQENLDIYPFAIRINQDGELWLHNAETVEKLNE